jgi:uncharacterized protein with GYD domain
MATYFCLMGWTEEGVRHLKGAPERARRAEQLAQQLGVKLTSVYLTLGGQYDLVARVDTDDPNALARFVLAVQAQGNVRINTVRALPREEFEQIIQSLP